MTETERASNDISRRLDQIARAARARPGAITTLAHHIDLAWLREAHRRTRKDGACGVDGRSSGEYAMKLEDNLRSLLDRAKSGTYRAPPVRRVHIPKDGKETRPLGIPTFEDKVLQRAVAMLLEAVYEQDFLDCSFGFRPGRSAQQALSVLQTAAVNSAGGWAIEVDIRKFFDSVDHAVLREVLRRRVRDGVILRLIGKWLNAGVLEDGAVKRLDSGTPHGGVISPMLANILLHEVLDAWFQDEVKPRLRGQGTLVRYADDAVMMFSTEADAKRVFDVCRSVRQVRTHYIRRRRARRLRATRPSLPDRSRRRSGTPAPWNLRLPRLHHPLGQGPRWEVAGTDTNIQEPLPAHAEGHRDVVPDASSPRHR